MRGVPTTLALMVLFSTVVASSDRVSCTVKVRNIIDGPRALHRAYLKYGITVPNELAKRASQGVGPVVGSVSAVPIGNDIEYLSTVQIRDRQLALNFDTASSDLWIFSSTDPSNFTYEPIKGLTWSVSYVDGTGASGVVFADRVTIGNATVTSQVVQAATSVSSRLISSEPGDGVLGLGFNHINSIRPTKQRTWFDNIKSSLKEPLFTLSLKNNAPGVYDFGFIDENKHDGPIEYVPIDARRGYWEFRLSGFQVGDSSPSLAAFQVIADTATTLMLLPRTAVEAYYSEVQGAQYNQTEGGFVFPCSSPLPRFVVHVDDLSLTVPSHLVNRSVSLTPGSTSCYGGIQTGSGTLGILGDVFLKSQFVVFDAGTTDREPRIGFTKQTSA